MADVTFGGVGTPVYDGTIGVQQLPSATNFNTTGKDTSLGAPGAIFPPPEVEVRQNGLQQLDPNDNSSKTVELYPNTGSIFPNVGQTIQNIVPDPNDSRNVIVELIPGGVVFFNNVTFVTGNTVNVR
jgi:hypothetical protein